MYSYSKKITAQLLLCSLLLESCHSPNLGPSKKNLPAPATPTYQQQTHDQPLPTPSRAAPSTRPTSWRNQHQLLLSQKALKPEPEQWSPCPNYF